jgi:DNA modification methylase
MLSFGSADCRERMSAMVEASVDAIVCDPPYELGFMGKSWDRSGIANDSRVWQEALRILKPGAHLVAFSGTRTYHRMVCAIEDAGLRDPRPACMGVRLGLSEVAQRRVGRHGA